MKRLLAGLCLGLGLCLSSPAHAERAVITTTHQGTDLTVVVHGVTDYCSTNASTDVIRQNGVIRIVRERPTVVSRCVSSNDRTFVVHDVASGDYEVSYEQVPYVAPVMYRKLASAFISVRD